MQAFYFGTSEQPLLGVYHEPRGARGRDASVLLCPPLGHEYLRTHRALRNLAGSLVLSGYPAFRFDYSGTGDSADSRDGAGGVAQWLADIGLAIDEVKEVSGRPRVILVGVRFGATLAVLSAATARADIERLVLWDPVVTGARYLAALEQMHDRWMRTLPREGDRQVEDPPEFFGFPWPASTGREIAAVDLSVFEWPRSRPVHIFDSSDHTAGQGLSGRLSTRGLPHTWARVADRAEWDREQLAQAALFPHEMVRTIAELLETLS